ncbi:hypothetical protein Tco_0001205 [Tanacetum coccineum]
MLPRNLKNMEWNLSDPVDTPLVGSYYENWTRSKGIPVDHNSIQEWLAPLCTLQPVEPDLNTMAEQNVPNQPPTRTDEQIVPRSQWLTIGKSNLLFNAQKIQKNPIFQISMDILSNTNFFQAFTASANVPAIYLQ